MIANLQHCIHTAGGGCMLCTVRFPYNLFDPLIGHWTIWFYYSPNQTTSIQGHPIMTKHGAHTLAISNCISLLAGLSGEKYGNYIHTQTGNNQKARNKVCCKLVWTLSSVVHLHTFFEHIVGGKKGDAIFWMVTSAFKSYIKIHLASSCIKQAVCYKWWRGGTLILTLGTGLYMVLMIRRVNDHKCPNELIAWLIYQEYE